MADSWFYRMFGEEFGPMTFKQLKELADGGTIQAQDFVRRSANGEWVAAVTINGLGLSTSVRDSGFAPDTIATTKKEAPASSTADEWFSLSNGQQTGPHRFEELVTRVASQQLKADDQVKLGNDGKWRPVGSIGRLMAALPYQAVKKTISSAPAQRKSDAAIRQPAETQVRGSTPAVAQETPAPVEQPRSDANRAVPATTPAPVSASDQAEADFKAAEVQAHSLIAWASAPNVDRCWWTWSANGEFGPIDFAHLFALASSGQLKPTDFVRNGLYGQYAASGHVPGLFQAIEIMARATDAVNRAASSAPVAAATAAPAAAQSPAKPLEPAPAKPAEPVAAAKPVQPSTNSNAKLSTPKSNPAVETVPAQTTKRSDPQIATKAAANPLPAPEPRTAPPQPTSSPAIRSNSGSMSTRSSAGSIETVRPPVMPARTLPARSTRSSESSWMSGAIDAIKDPKGIGAICAVAVAALIAGWGYLPKGHGADLKRYQALKQLVDEIQSAQKGSPGQVPALQQKLEATAKEILAAVKDSANNDDPVKQGLLWATRDEIPRFIQAGLVVDSQAGRNLTLRLHETAFALKLESKPAVNVAQSVPSPGD